MKKTENKIESPLMRFKEVSQYVCLGEAAIYRAMAEERFPRPIKLTHKSVAWLKSEIEEWLQERIEARGEPLRKRA